jgi:hypothetical protein
MHNDVPLQIYGRVWLAEKTSLKFVGVMKTSALKNDIALIIYISLEK